MKVHLPEDGEQADANPTFWETLGGIGLAILGGIVWVGEKAAY
jgi:hypothetical protein